MKKNTIKKIGAGIFALALTITPLASSIRSFADGAIGKYTIKLKSQSKDGDSAKFRIVEKALIGEDGRETESGKTLTDVALENNEATYKVDKKGVYTIKQIRRAPGFLLNEKEATVEFPIMKDGVPSKDQEQIVEVKHNLIQKDFEFTKVKDGTDNPLDGPQFKLKRIAAPETIADDNTVSKWKTVNDNELNATAQNGGKVSFKNLKEGKYEIIETSTVDGYASTNKKITFTVTAENNQPIIKDVLVDGKLVANANGIKFQNHKLPTVEKDIINPTNQKAVKQLDTNVLVDYKYVLKVTVPTDITSYEKFVVEDTLNENLSTPTVEKVTNNGKVLGKDIVKIEGNKIIVSPKIKELVSGNLEVTINTKVKADTKLNTIPNDFTLDYKTGGNHEGKITSNKVIVNVTKGSVEFIKTESDGKTPLKGAEFKLYKLDEKGTVEIDGKKYSEAIDPKTSKPYPTFVTGADGKVSQKDLPFGTYAFKEVKAPEGYRLMNKAIKFEINKEHANLKLDNVKNYKIGQIVVNTGTIGVALAAITGIGVMATGFVLNKRKNQKIEK